MRKFEFSAGQLIQIERYQKILESSQYFELMESIEDRRFSAKDLGISYRELHHWSSKNLLYQPYDFGKTRKFNLIELVWVELLKELRLYKFPLIGIARLKANLQRNFDVTDVKEKYKEELKAFTLDQLRKSMPQADFEDFMTNPLYADLHDFSLKLSEINYFKVIIFEVYILKLNYRLLINSNGDYDLCNDIDYQNQKMAGNIDGFETSFITISLGSLLAKIFTDFKVEELRNKWMLIDEKEEKVLNMLRSPWEIKSITIRFNDKFELDLIERTQVMQISPQDYLKRIMIAGGYERIEIVTQKGDIVYCEKTTKEKL